LGFQSLGRFSRNLFIFFFITPEIHPPVFVPKNFKTKKKKKANYDEAFFFNKKIQLVTHELNK
jgi:hypothetical protein